MAERVDHLCYMAERIAAMHGLHPRRIYSALRISAPDRDAPLAKTTWKAAIARRARTKRSYSQSLGFIVLAAEAKLDRKHLVRKFFEDGKAVPQRYRRLATSRNYVTTIRYLDADLGWALVVYLQLKPL